MARRMCELSDMLNGATPPGGWRNGGKKDNWRLVSTVEALTNDNDKSIYRKQISLGL